MNSPTKEFIKDTKLAITTLETMQAMLMQDDEPIALVQGDVETDKDKLVVAEFWNLGFDTNQTLTMALFNAIEQELDDLKARLKQTTKKSSKKKSSKKKGA